MGLREQKVKTAQLYLKYLKPCHMKRKLMFSLSPGGRAVSNKQQSKAEMLLSVQRSEEGEEDLTLHLLNVYVPDIALSAALHTSHF